VKKLWIRKETLRKLARPSVDDKSRCCNSNIRNELPPVLLLLFLSDD
jgi:hypothetical protein